MFVLTHGTLRWRMPLLSSHRLSSDDDLSNTKISNSRSDRRRSFQMRIRGLVRAYGSTALIFYTTISTTSLATFYLLVSYGVDVQAALTYLGISQTSRLASGASTFVIAYACHKILLPVRLAITATGTPLIVRYLRQLGWIKKSIATQDDPTNA